MKYLIVKDKTKRKLNNQTELKRMYLKSITHNLALDIGHRNTAMAQLNDISKNSNPCRIKNRCIMTGTAKSINRDFRVSRMKLRELALNGILPGVARSTW